MDFGALRKLMVDRQLKGRDITDERVLTVFLEVSRHEFVQEELKSSAYDDCPLPIGQGQTISQPYMVALMTQILKLQTQERVLEIGTGSGYQSAILARLCKEVYSVERIDNLAQGAQNRLKKLGFGNVHIVVADGTMGLEQFAPYDAIIVTAASPQIPEVLLAQLENGGRLAIPVGDRFSQVLTLCEKKSKEEIIQKQICGCMFVPLLGKEGWPV